MLTRADNARLKQLGELLEIEDRKRALTIGAQHQDISACQPTIDLDEAGAARLAF